MKDKRAKTIIKVLIVIVVLVLLVVIFSDSIAGLFEPLIGPGGLPDYNNQITPN